MDWKQAKEYLDELIQEYEVIGFVGRIGLIHTLYPLRRRYNNGERTQELYDEIMACE